MQQINCEFAECYYLTEEGKVYNSDTDKMICADKAHCFRLKTKDNITKKISLKVLYKKVYGKNFCYDNIENLENETWKPIELTDDIYWISSKGRVKSLVNYEAIILKPSLVNGYERVDIYQEGKRSSKLISRLVAASFLPLPQYQDMQLHHINGERSCNNVENLVWLTPKQHQEEHRKMKQEKEKIDNVRAATISKTVPNQRILTIHKEPTDKEHKYTANNLEALDEAAARLQSKCGFKLYMYLAKNQDKYNFALYSSNFCAWCGCAMTAYNTAFKELQSEGYLIPKEPGSTIYTFYDKAQKESENLKNSVVNVEIPREKVEELAAAREEFTFQAAAVILWQYNEKTYCYIAAI